LTRRKEEAWVKAKVTRKERHKVRMGGGQKSFIRKISSTEKESRAKSLSGALKGKKDGEARN